MNPEETDKLTLNEAMKEFNRMYNLPVNEKPSLLGIERLENFKKVITEEVNEVEEIIENYKKAKDSLDEEQKVELLTSVSDWLADMIWYIRSEAVKYGLDMDKTLDIIKGSNFSKLGADGKPIHDERGKVLKGPDYWAPEEKISKLLRESLKE